MPSPAMATTRPSLCSRSITAAFWSGSTSGITSSIDRRFATASAVVRLSPVSMTMRSPSAWSWAMASGVVSLIGSATPRGPPRRRRRRRTSPSALAPHLVGARRGLTGRHAELLEQPQVAERDAGRPRDPSRPSRARFEGVGRPLARRGARALDDRGRERVLAAALERRGHAQDVRLGRPLIGTTAASAGLPRVSVPVLSTTSVSTLRSTSIASAFLKSTPAAAPRPSPP
jgi:hypothetical protein